LSGLPDPKGLLVRLRSRLAVCVLTAVGVVPLTAALAATPAGASTRQAVAPQWHWPRHSSSPAPTPSPTDSSTPTPTPAPTDSSTPTPSPTDSSTATPTPNPPTTTPPADPTIDCGGETVAKDDGAPWVCTFDDEFDGSALDRGKWFVQTTAASGYHSGAECFVDSPNNISVSDGALHLTVRKESAPFTCTSPSGNYTTQYTSGTVNTGPTFSQTYGRFEVRAQLPAATTQGLQETLWLWPEDQFKYGAWPLSGEIDFAEVYSKYAGWNIPYIHYGVAQSTVNWNTNTNVYTALPAPYAQPGMDCRINAGQYNTYVVVWEPGRITIQVNGNDCIIDNYSATNAAPPAPFDQPFLLALTQALGIGSNAFSATSTPLPATTSVDYVRVWQ